MVSGLSLISPNTERPLKGEGIVEQGIIRRLFHERTVELNALWYRREDDIVRQETSSNVWQEGGETKQQTKKTKTRTNPERRYLVYLSRA